MIYQYMYETCHQSLFCSLRIGHFPLNRYTLYYGTMYMYPHTFLCVCVCVCLLPLYLCVCVCVCVCVSPLCSSCPPTAVQRHQFPPPHCQDHPGCLAGGHTEEGRSPLHHGTADTKPPHPQTHQQRQGRPRRQ